MIFSLLFLVTALNFELEGNTQECLSLYVKSGGEFFLEYMISGKRDWNVKTTVKSPQGTVIYESPPKSRQGSFEKTVDNPGSYLACF